MEVGEPSSPPKPLNVSEEIVELADYDMYDNDDLIAYPNIPKIQKWAAKTIHAAGELAGNPNDPRRTISQFEKCYLMIESNPMFS